MSTYRISPFLVKSIRKKNLIPYGNLYSWGLNSYNRLGLGPGTFTDPTLVTVFYDDADLSGSSADFTGYTPFHNDKIIQAVGAHASSFALDINGNLYACGSSLSNNTLGLSPGYTSFTSGRFVKNPYIDDVKYVNVGYYAAGAIKNDGTMWLWGPNRTGQCGTGYTNPYGIGIPTQETSLSTNWVKMVWGYQNDTTVALKSDGTIWASGKLSAEGIGETSDTTEFVQLDYISGTFNVSNNGWVDIHSGQGNFFFVHESGKAFGAHENNYGELGVGTSSNYTYPREIGNPVEDTDGIWKKVGGTSGWGGVKFNHFLDNTGKRWGAGLKSYGGFGDTTGEYDWPYSADDDTDWIDIMVADNHTMATKKNEVWGWGACPSIGFQYSAVKLFDVSGACQKIGVGDSCAYYIGEL